MRRSLVILCLLAGFAAAPLISHAQQENSPSNALYVGAFLDARKGEELANAGDTKGALQAYRAAADALSQIKQQFPAWQKELLDFRLGRVNEAIAQLQAKMAAAGPADGVAGTQPGPVPLVPDGVVPPIGAIPPKGVRPLPPPTPEDLNPPLIPDDPINPPKNVARTPKPPKTAAAPKDGRNIGEVVADQIQSLEKQVEEKDAALADMELMVKRLQTETQEAQKAQAKAEAARKNSDDLLEVIKREYLTLKDKGDGNSKRAQELEAEMTKLKARMETEAAERIAAEERAKQLAERTGALAEKVRGAGTLPAQVRKLEAELATERAARATLAEKLEGAIKERNEARLELTKLKEGNKDLDKLMADNASLQKKLTDTQKQIQQFEGDATKKDAEIALLRKQVTDTQKALVVSQEKNTTLQAEIGDLRKKMDDYTKQLAQYKTEKQVSSEERRKLDEENKLLQGIVMRVLQEDANRAQRRKMVQKEMERLHIQSDVLLKHVSFLAESPIKLTNAERKLFKNSILKMPSPNELGMVLPAKPEGGETPTEPKAPPSGESESTPLPTPDPENGAKPEKAPEGAKADPVKTPELPKPETSTEASKPPSGSPTADFEGLPPDAKPIAEKAKKAFEGENYPEAEKLYTRAMMFAPNNLYVVSNLGVAQFRSQKYKNAEESFRKAITIAPEDAFSWCTLGIVQYSQNKFDDAVTSLTKSIAINAKNPTARNYLGITAAQKGWIEHARKELETAIQLDPKYADAYFNLAVTYTLMKPPNIEEARKAYKKSLELGAAPDPAMENTLNGETPEAGAGDNEPKGAGAEINR